MQDYLILITISSERIKKKRSKRVHARTWNRVTNVYLWINAFDSNNFHTISYGISWLNVEILFMVVSNIFVDLYEISDGL